jgi:hypothetical protein
LATYSLAGKETRDDEQNEDDAEQNSRGTEGPLDLQLLTAPRPLEDVQGQGVHGLAERVFVEER